MFVGREAELKDLKNLFLSDTFECIVVYGRRRIGKTSLISKACEGVRTIFHLSTITTEKKTLSDLSTSAFEGLGEGDGLEFRTLDAFLQYIHLKALEETLVLVIDELPFLVKSISDAMGTLQRFIDLKFPDSKLKLILSGSSVSFMEHQVLGEKSPLYGRRTAQFKLRPFGLKETSMMYAGSQENTILIQLFTGGIPLYVSYFSPKESIEDGVGRLFFNSNGLLYNEPMNILNMEVNEPQTFFTVLELISRGANKQSELADKIGMSVPNIKYYLTILQNMGIIERKFPLGETNRKKSIWFIKDHLFNFYFTHVYPFRSLIERGVTDGVISRFRNTLSAYVGKPFEELCREYVLNYSMLPITSIGSWWGTDPRSRREEEIDVVAKTYDGDTLFGECKYTNEPIGIRIYTDLIRISMNIPCNRNRYYWFFSKSGFTKEMYRKAENNMSIHLVELKDFFEF